MKPMLIPSIKNMFRSTCSIQNWLVFLLATLFMFIVAVLFSVSFEEWTGQLIGVTKDTGAKMEVLKFLGLSIGGVLLIMQALSANRRAKAMEDTVKYTEKGQRQERLKNAIEHLGAPAVSVRLGGILELFHLAEDTIEWRQSILDILCAHVRRTTHDKDYQDKQQREPSEEIQSILTLLFVQEHTLFQGLQVNLERVWLNGADLRGARLQGVKLNNARLQWAHLDDAQMQEAVLSQAHLQGANLCGVQLLNSALYRARLQGANVLAAKLQGACLVESQLQGAKLINTWLQTANLFGAQMQGADLGGARLQLANLSEAQVQGAHLEEAGLQGANLTNAEFQGAWLRSAQLQGAIFKCTKFQGATSEFGDAPFKERMENQVGHDGNLSNVIFFGGLAQHDLDLLVKGLPDGKAMDLQEKLMWDVDEAAIYEPASRLDTITEPPYSKEEAEQWIAKYEKAIIGSSKEGAN